MKTIVTRASRPCGPKDKSKIALQSELLATRGFFRLRSMESFPRVPSQRDNSWNEFRAPQLQRTGKMPVPLSFCGGACE